MFFAELDESARAHLRRALAAHSRWCRENGVQFPSVLDPLLVRNGQERTRSDGAEDVFDSARMMRLAYTYKDVGEQLGVGEKTVRRLVDAGELRAVTIGGANRRIARDDLLRYLESLRERSVAS